MPDVVGITGTREGWTEAQREVFNFLIVALGCHEFHHGVCVGVDADAAVLANQHGMVVVGHRSTLKSLESPRALEASRRVLPPLPPLERNVAIVAAVDQLIACPKLMIEEVRSGTWHCVRAARKSEKAVTLIYPDGSTKTQIGEACLA